MKVKLKIGLLVVGLVVVTGCSDPETHSAYIKERRFDACTDICHSYRGFTKRQGRLLRNQCYDKCLNAFLLEHGFTVVDTVQTKCQNDGNG